LDNKLIIVKPSKILDELYSTGKQPFDIDTPSSDEQMVLHHSNGKRIADALEIPELDIEMDRAVWQVETALKRAEREHNDAKAKETEEAKQKKS
jgi:hypothetical protein